RRRPHADPLLRPPTRAVALRVSPAQGARGAARLRLLARRPARARLGQRHREHGPHRRRAREDAARQDEGDRPERRADPHASRQRLRARRRPARGADPCGAPGLRRRRPMASKREDSIMNRVSPGRRGALALLVSLPAALRVAHAVEASPGTYAVLSLVGDQLTIVTRRLTTGTQLDPNDRQVLP